MKWISSSQLVTFAVVAAVLCVLHKGQSLCEAFAPPLPLCSSSVVRVSDGDGFRTHGGFRIERTSMFARPLSDSSLRYSSDGGQSSTSLVAPTPQSFSSSLWSGSTLRFNPFGDPYDTELSSSLSAQQATENDEILSYLDVDLQQLPPKTRKLLGEATWSFLDHDKDPVSLKDILSTIDTEYAFEAVPFSIGTMSFVERDKEMQQVSKILSFAALHRVPREITRQLLASLQPSDGSKLNVPLLQVINQSDTAGWEAIAFPKGLSLRLKRRFLPSISTRFSPVPRRAPLIGGRRNAIEEANVALEEAALATPPYRPMSREQFLESMNEAAVDSKSQLFNAPEDAADDLFFFPQRKRLWKRFTNLMNRQTERLKSAGRAGVISYGFLNFLWYTFAVVFQWRRVTARMAAAAATAGEGAAAVAAGAGVVATAATTASAAATAPVALSVGATLLHSLRKFGNVFLTVYVGSQVTKLPRLSLAVALAPLGDRMLRFIQRKLGVSEGRAFWILFGALWVSCFGIWTSIIFADAIAAKFMAATSTTASTSAGVGSAVGAGGMAQSTPGAILTPLSSPPIQSMVEGTGPLPELPTTLSLESPGWT